MRQLLDDDELHLRRALALAREAAGLASPNPTVGCVIVRGDTVLGEGAHLYDARDHAEIAALKAAAASGHDVRGATVYVTLEPCSHHGRTGPCADALIAVGVSRCVIATVDPNPQVRGSGIAKLRTAGVDVHVVPPEDALAREAQRLNDAFAFSIQNGRPFVTLKAALSVDGKLAPPAAQRTAATPHWLTGEAARADVQLLRHSADAILTGIGTVLADDPLLTDRTGLARRRPLSCASSSTAVCGRRWIRDWSSRSGRTSCSSATRRRPRTACRACPTSASRLCPLKAMTRGVWTFMLRSPSFAAATSRVCSSKPGRRSTAAFLPPIWSTSLSSTTPRPNSAQTLSPSPEKALRRTSCNSACNTPNAKAFPTEPAEDVRVSGYLHDPWLLIPNP